MNTLVVTLVGLDSDVPDAETESPTLLLLVTVLSSVETLIGPLTTVLKFASKVVLPAR